MPLSKVLLLASLFLMFVWLLSRFTLAASCSSPLVARQSRLLLWQESHGSAAVGPTHMPPSLLRDSFMEPSQPVMQVVLQVPKAAESTSYVEGSVMTLEASIQPALNWTRKLYVDECVGSQGQQLNHSQRLSTLIFNHGCLSIGSNPSHWFRKDNGTLQFSVGAFMLRDDVDESEVFVTCWVSIWSWKRHYGQVRKSCVYNTTSHSWQFANNEGDSSFCDCCDFGCPLPKKGHHKEFPEEGESQMVVIGPLKVRKPPAVSWFRASCRTLKELLLVALAFTCVALLFLLILRTMLRDQLPCLPFHRRVRLRRSSLTSLESPGIDLVARATCSPGEGNEEASSTIEENL